MAEQHENTNELMEESVKTASTKEEVTNEITSEDLESALKKFDYNELQTANHLGISLEDLQKKRVQHNSYR